MMISTEKFSDLFHCGHGRCAVILENAADVSIYRATVLEGCRRNFAYDAQCEGTRARYVYRLTKFFDDRSVFVEEACGAFDKIEDRWGWEFYHLCDLLALFACEGIRTAADALLKKYGELRDILILKNEFTMIDSDREHFNHIAAKILEFCGIEGFSAVTADIGKIISKNPHYDGDDFDAFEFNAKQFLGEETVELVLEDSRNEMTLLYRESMKKTHEKYRAAAEVMKAQSSRRRPPEKEDVFDVPALLETLNAASACYDDGYGSGHHGACSDLIRAREKGYDVPDEALLRIYETTLCSCCRYEAVKLLGEAGRLTCDMIKECGNDCYEHTRNLIKEYEK